MPAPSAPRMRGFGTDGRPFRTQTSRWLSEAAGDGRAPLPRRARIRDVLVREGPPARRPRGSAPPAWHDPLMTLAELRALAEELGLDVVGAAPAAPYEETERHIRQRRARGLFGAMRFTMAHPEVSCHPEMLLEGARTVVSAALCYCAGARARPGEGRLPRYAWRDNYALLRERLDALGRRLGGNYRVLVDANHHVDREGAERAGVGFIRQEHDADHARGTARGSSSGRSSPTSRSSRRRRSSSTAAAARSASMRARPARSTSPASSMRTDACPTGRRRPAHPGGVSDELERSRLRLRHLPGRLPLEPRRRSGGAATSSRGDAMPSVSLVEWLERDGAALVEELDRLYVPQNDPRWLRRNALVALGNVGEPGDAHAGRAVPRRRGAGESRRVAAEQRERIAESERMSEPDAARTCSRTSCAAPSRRSWRSPAAAAIGPALERSAGGCSSSRSRRAATSSGSSRDPELVSLRLERVDVGALVARARGTRTSSVTRRSGDSSRERRSDAPSPGDRKPRLERPATRPTRRDRGGGRRTASSSSTCRRRPRGRPGLDVFARGTSGAARRGSGSGSRGRSPRRTAGRWSSRRPRAGGAGSGSSCRRFRRRAEPELGLERVRARRDGATHRDRLEHDRLPAVGEHLGEQPLLAS